MPRRDGGGFEHGDPVVCHELGGDRTTAQCGEFLSTAGDILFGLLPSVLVLSTLCLNGNDILTATSINPDVQLIDLNLPDSLHRSSQMVLQ